MGLPDMETNNDSKLRKTISTVWLNPLQKHFLSLTHVESVLESSLQKNNNGSKGASYKPTLRHVWKSYLVSFSSSMSSKSEFSTSSSSPFSEGAMGGIVLVFSWDALFMVEPASFWLEEMGFAGCEQVWWSLKQFYMAEFFVGTIHKWGLEDYGNFFTPSQGGVVTA